MFVRITIQIQEFQTDFLKLLDSANSNNFEGSAVLAKACGLRVLLVMLKIIPKQEPQLMLTNPRDALLSGRTMRGRVIAYFVFLKRRPSAILDFMFSQFL